MPPRLTRSPSTVPAPDAAGRFRESRLSERIDAAITEAGGVLPFDRFMELALYAPELGYYSGGARKFGVLGDFVTAPELSPLFGYAVARQAGQVLGHLGGGRVLELGGGSGRLAADLLGELERLDRLPERYLMLELSAELKARQRATLEACVPHLAGRVDWLEELPTGALRGLVIANEVVDAMPVSRFRIERGQVLEELVVVHEGRFAASWRPAATPGLAAAVVRLAAELGPFADGYESEINLRAPAWIEAIAQRLDAGLLLLIDYGYPRREYYHPQRRAGTLMCHYRHRAHPDPLVLVGLQDITAHVDFTALAEAALRVGLRVHGFAPQGHFLLASGLDGYLERLDPEDEAARLRRLQEIKMLTLPSQMGERFKLLALSRGLDLDLIGFALRDFRDAL